MGIDDIRRDPDASSDRLYVSYKIDFEVVNASRTVAGIASYEAVIVGLAANPKIESISETVLKRDRYRPLDD